MILWIAIRILTRPFCRVSYFKFKDFETETERGHVLPVKCHTEWRYMAVLSQNVWSKNWEQFFFRFLVCHIPWCVFHSCESLNEKHIWWTSDNINMLTMNTLSQTQRKLLGPSNSLNLSLSLVLLSSEWE